MQPLPLIVALIFFLLGIIGTFLPILPGVFLIWVGMFIYGIMTGFEGLSFSFFFFQGMAALLVIVVDYMAVALGSKKFGGPKAASWGAAWGILLGFLVMGPAGIIFGPFLGALAGGFLVGLPLKRAIHVSFGALIGFLGGLVLKLAMEAAMIIWFFITLL